MARTSAGSTLKTTGAPKVDLCTGNFSGYVWSANCGWISLSNAVAYVQTDTIQQGALAPDGLPIAWLLANFGTTNVDANADPDDDGKSNTQNIWPAPIPTTATTVCASPPSPGPIQLRLMSSCGGPARRRDSTESSGGTR